MEEKESRNNDKHKKGQRKKPRTLQDYLNDFKRNYRHNPRKNPRPPLGLWVIVKPKKKEEANR